MARSLNVKHEETLSFSPLFVGFLLLSVTCMMLSAASGWADHPESTQVAPVEAVSAGVSIVP